MGDVEIESGAAETQVQIPDLVPFWTQGRLVSRTGPFFFFPCF